MKNSGLPYQANMMQRLTEGASFLPGTFAKLIENYFRSIQEPDGGFRGRKPGGDVYYTAFALRGLAIVGALDNSVCTQAGNFLISQLKAKLSLADAHSLVYSSILVALGGGPDVFENGEEWISNFVQRLNATRASDGGFGQKKQPEEGSTYMSFLALLTLQMLGMKLESPEEMKKYILKREKTSGGFSEHKGVNKSPGTNPTAAGIGILKILAPNLLQNRKEKLVSLITSRQGPEGGFLANPRIPWCDTLSTFTALWSLEEMESLDPKPSSLNLSNVLKFILGTQRETGGFGGGNWDSESDVEYTFYAFGSLALLAGIGKI